MEARGKGMIKEQAFGTRGKVERKVMMCNPCPYLHMHAQTADILVILKLGTESPARRGAACYPSSGSSIYEHVGAKLCHITHMV